MNESLEMHDTISFKKISETIIQRLIKATINEATSGAKIIVWSEISSKILRSDEDSLIKVFKAVAKREKIYLLTTPFFAATDGSKSENKILLFAPNGDLVLTHLKYGGNFMGGTVEGNKTVKNIATPYGSLAALICWDADFPSIVKKISKSNTDILLILPILSIILWEYKASQLQLRIVSVILFFSLPGYFSI